MWVSLENSSEEWRTCGENHFVCLQLVPLTGQRHVKKVLVVPQLFEGRTHVALELVPLEAEIL